MGAGSRRDRLARAVVFGVLTTALAAFGHWLGSGLSVAALPLAIAVVAGSGVGWAVVARRRARTVVLASMAIQLAMHLGFCLSMPGHHLLSMSMIMCGTWHGATPPLTTLVATHSSGLGALFALTGLPMLAAHAGAAALSGAWLHTGEALVVSLAATLAAAAARLFARPVRPLAPRAAARPVASVSPSYSRRGRSVGAFGLRGPPLALGRS